jgi:hypothetical protein
MCQWRAHLSACGHAQADGHESPPRVTPHPNLLPPWGEGEVEGETFGAIHGSLPDCWRFNEHGLRVLRGGFRVLEMNPVETPDRPLMPVHYTVVEQKLSRGGRRQ